MSHRTVRVKADGSRVTVSQTCDHVLEDVKGANGKVHGRRCRRCGEQWCEMQCSFMFTGGGDRCTVREVVKATKVGWRCSIHRGTR